MSMPDSGNGVNCTMTKDEKDLLARLTNALERIAGALEDPAPFNVRVVEIVDAVTVDGSVTTHEGESA